MMTSIIVYCGLLLIGMIAALEIGRRLGAAQVERDPEGAGKGIGAMEGAVFALLGLLLAFTFSGAATRFDHRRDLIVQEANAIGTAYLRLDLLSAEAQGKLRPLFRRYVEERLATYRRVGDPTKVAQSLARDQALQQQIWQEATAAARQSSVAAAPVLVLPAINDMIDITTTRHVATHTHTPTIIYVMLFCLALAASLLAGFGLAQSRKRHWTHMFAFALVVAGTIYVILDLEYPRLGLIRVSGADQVLIELLQSMK